MIRPSSPRRASVAALSGAALMLMIAMFAIGAGPVGAVDTTTTTAPTAPTTTTTAPTTTTAAPTTTEAPQTTTTQRNTSTTQRSTTTSSTSRTSSTTTSSSTTTTVVAAVGSGSKDSSDKGSPFWSTGRKIAVVVTLLLVAAVAMGVLTYFYWQATRPGGTPPSDSDGIGSGGIADTTGPVGPVSPMLAEALRPDPFVTRDDLGLL
ncbi:MAG: hypothetical protein QNL69_00030 [Acidimicrobiales bacterium]